MKASCLKLEYANCKLDLIHTSNGNRLKIWKFLAPAHYISSDWNTSNPSILLKKMI